MPPQPGDTKKICIFCRQDCAGRPRIKDKHGRYACQACVDERKQARRRAAAAAPASAARDATPAPAATPDTANPPNPPAPHDPADPADPADNAPFALEADTLLALEASAAAAPPALQRNACPECGFRIDDNAVLCLNCGFNTKTQRAAHTKQHAQRAPKQHRPPPPATAARTAVALGLAAAGAAAAAAAWVALAAAADAPARWMTLPLGLAAGAAALFAVRGAGQWKTGTAAAAAALLVGATALALTPSAATPAFIHDYATGASTTLAEFEQALEQYQLARAAREEPTTTPIEDFNLDTSAWIFAGVSPSIAPLADVLWLAVGLLTAFAVGASNPDPDPDPDPEHDDEDAHQ